MRFLSFNENAATLKRPKNAKATARKLLKTSLVRIFISFSFLLIGHFVDVFIFSALRRFSSVMAGWIV